MNKKITILVVDDNDQNRYLLKVLLEGHGYQPILAMNGNQALDLAAINPPDMIISDILMPGMDGFALCRQWNSNDKLKGIPFVFYTATYTDPKDEAFSLSLGAARFIRKPEDPRRFIETIQSVLDEYAQGALVKSKEPLEKEDIFYKQYNEALIRKMEDKLLELERANQKLSDMFEKSKDLTYRIEAGLRAGNLAWWEMEIPSGKVTFDERKVDMIGFPAEMFRTYEDFTNLIHADDYSRVMQAMRDHLEGKKDLYEAEYRMKTSSGNYKWFRDVGAIVEKNMGTGTTQVIGIVDDISKRKETEGELEKYSNHLEELVAERTQALEKAQKELVEKEKLSILGQLAGSVGHELRNPLGVINNATYILKANLEKENVKARECADLIASQVQRSNKIITDLLSFARESAADRAEIDVEDLLTSVMSNCPPPENIIVETDFSPQNPKIYADRYQMEQVLLNILSNAYQAMPQGGKIRIESSRKGRNMVISVSDNGPGISKQDMGKLFTPLFTTKIIGIGLGLAVSRKFMTANKGTIKAVSKIGRGTTFVMTVPAAEDKNA